MEYYPVKMSSDSEVEEWKSSDDFKEDTDASEFFFRIFNVELDYTNWEEYCDEEPQVELEEEYIMC